MQLKTTITWYCTPVTPATQEQRSRGSWVKASPGKKWEHSSSNKLDVVEHHCNPSYAADLLAYIYQSGQNKIKNSDSTKFLQGCTINRPIIHGGVEVEVKWSSHFQKQCVSFHLFWQTEFWTQGLVLAGQVSLETHSPVPSFFSWIEFTFSCPVCFSFLWSPIYTVFSFHELVLKIFASPSISTFSPFF
jgi:hypothetical protein